METEQIFDNIWNKKTTTKHRKVLEKANTPEAQVAEKTRFEAEYKSWKGFTSQAKYEDQSGNVGVAETQVTRDKQEMLL